LCGPARGWRKSAGIRFIADGWEEEGLKGKLRAEEPEKPGTGIRRRKPKGGTRKRASTRSKKKRKTHFLGCKSLIVLVRYTKVRKS